MKLIPILFFAFLLNNQDLLSQINKKLFDVEYKWSKKCKIESIKYKSKNEILGGYIINYSDSIFPNQEILKYKKLMLLDLVYTKYPDLSNNCINRNPKIVIDTVKLKELKHLKRLSFDGHPFDGFPKELYLLDSLKSLSIIRSNLKEIPNDIWRFKNIVELDLMANCINDISCNISMLQNLKSLKLNNNRFTYVPECLKDIPNIESIDFSGIFRPGTGVNENLIDIKSLENIIAIINKESVKFIGIRILNSEEHSKFIHSINDKVLIKKVGFDFKYYDL